MVNPPLVLSLMMFISIGFLRCLPETYNQDMEEYKLDWSESVMKLQNRPMDTSKFENSGFEIELLELDKSADRGNRE